jgi:dienelactone hydrolase
VLLLELSALTNAQVLTLGGNLLCDVAVYHIEYTTVGGAGESITASGAMMVPFGLDSSCRGSRPMLLYAHGTSTDRAFNIADLKGQKNGEGFFMAFFASQGYIVVAPNFAGYDTSTLSYHPYLIADQQSKDMIDALAAARSALPTAAAPTTRDGGRLFITGYSQGGYVAMATHRAMQASGMPVTASAPMSGPYALAAFVDAVFLGRVSGSSTVSSVMLFDGYQRAYSNIYASTADVFETQYLDGIESLLPGAMPRSDLYVQGKLPEHALFSETPPDSSSADITPAATPANLASVFALGFGSGNLIRNSYRLSYLRDVRANPDGGWPTTTTGMAAAAPGLPLRQALRRNDLRDWTPTAPVLLCGGNADPVVFWLNTQLMQGYWAPRAPASARISVLDVDSAASSGDPYASIKADFARAKQLVAAAAVLQGATDGGKKAVFDVYHAPLVPPFCLAAVKSFFAAQ